MEKMSQVEDQSIPTHSPPTSGPSVNWSLLSIPDSALSCSPGPPPTSSAVHALQTKVKTLTLRRQRGREREREKFDSAVPVFDPAGHAATSLVLPRERARCKGKVPPLSAPTWRSAPLSKLSSSEEEEEVEVQVKLEIHSPPPEAPGEPGSQGRGEEKSAGGGCLSDQPRGLGEGASLDDLNDSSSSGKEDAPAARPPAPPTPASTSSSTLASAASASPSSSTSSSATRHWAPPKGFWRIVRPETLLLNGVPSSSPLRDHAQTGAAAAKPQRKPSQTEEAPAEAAGDLGSAVDAVDDGEVVPSEFKHSDSLDCYLDRYEQKEAEPSKPETTALLLGVDGSMDSESAQSGTLSNDEKAETRHSRACRRPKERRQHTSREEGEQSHYSDEACKVDRKDDQASDSSIPPQEPEQCPRSLIVPEHVLPLSPRHEQAKLLLERARLKARSNPIKGDRPTRRSQSDQRCHTKSRSTGPATTPARQPPQPVAQLTAPVLEIDPSPPTDLQGGQSQRQACSPTRVRFEDESEKEAESRYLDRQRGRGRPRAPTTKTKNKAENNPDCSDSGSDRGRGGQRSVSMPPPALRQEDVAARCQVTTVIKEVIVLVKKCEACGSVVREPPSLPSEAQSAAEPQQLSKAEDSAQGKTSLRCASPSRPEASTRPKVTFAGAFVLGESKESGSKFVCRNSKFGKLRRRSRKEESRLESGHGPYGPSWARRNSAPRSRAGRRRAISFAPGSPVAVEPHALPTQLLPMKSALKSSSKNRSEVSSLVESQGQRGELSKASSQGTPVTTFLVPCAELRDATPNGTGVILSDVGQRALALSRPEDLRAVLLRSAAVSAHLKAEVHWEENSDGSRKLLAERDGRPKLSLRRLLSSIGLNSVVKSAHHRLVKSARSSSMEQLSIPMPPPRASSASPTRRPPDPNIRRRPSLQTMHSQVFPVAQLHQLRKASSVQSLERRTERSTILGEVQPPYGLATILPSPESPQTDEAVLPSRVVRPVGRVSQAFPDGTLLLELTRPPNGPFGFVISRGKVSKTGVYVEKVGDGAGEGLYVGLLGVGDEILEVNGEAVAGFSLDQVTRLLTRDSTAFIRVTPSRRNQR